MDVFSSLLFFIPETFGYLGELFFLIALFLIYKKFKSIETYIMFYTLLVMTILSYTMQYIMHRPESIYIKSGEMISLTQLSQIFEYGMYVLPYLSIIVYSALLVFAIKLHRK